MGVGYRFASLTLDPARRELRRGSELIPVQPQVFDLLLYLVQNRDRIVSKDDLIEAVWHGRIVSESTLTSRINAARKAIGDSGETQTLIRTIARRGFRFVGAVHTETGDHEPNPANRSEQSDPAALASPTHCEPASVKERKFGWISAGSIIAALIMMLLYQFTPLAGIISGTIPTARTPETSSFAPSSVISVAVLPFENISPDAEHELLAEGVTEEITSALARIPDLHVVARMSAFEFKGRNNNVQETAKALHATHLVDGYVEQTGDQIQITARLVHADDGAEIWSNSYQRELVELFRIREEIARAVAASLHAPLTLAASRTSIGRDIDSDSYQKFLHAKALIQQRRLSVGLIDAVPILEQVVARNPNFAPGWAQLALGYQRLPRFHLELEIAPAGEKGRAVDAWLPKAEAASRRAIELDPDLPDAYSSLGLSLAVRGKLVEADALVSKALELDPFHPEALHNYSIIRGAVGQIADALELKQRLLAIEPFVPVYNGGMVDLLWANGQTDVAIAKLRSESTGNNLAHLAAIYWAGGESDNMFETLSMIPEDSFPDGMVERAIQELRGDRPETALPQGRPRFSRRLDFVYFYLGVADRTLERFEDDVADDFLPPNEAIALWTPIYAPARATQRFKAFARDAGFVEYWQAKGWPDFCRPVGDDDFECD